ncbi:hypothetical protein [Sinomicrobium pectinilyticum]|uniref:hypothetical protein n=1 Tax=Sinomicrobium pectinilyticum TaxID=1084421 RepID=UPI0011CD4BD9|nr:hypothetical protein [Sinomicrobium pectinilyticum]
MNYEKIITCNRCMLPYVEIDDQLENASFKKIERMRGHIMGYSVVTYLPWNTVTVWKDKR